jgi:hypothetical protein
MNASVTRNAFFALWIFVYLITPVLSMAQVDKKGPVLEFDLDSLRWKHRILLLFSPSESDSSFRLQKQDLASRAQEVIERDLMVLEILEHGESRALDRILSEKTAEGIRSGFGVRPGRFQVLLIGKDGGVKLRSERPVTVQDILGLIDSMPMRRQEMDSQKR